LTVSDPSLLEGREDSWLCDSGFYLEPFVGSEESESESGAYQLSANYVSSYSSSAIKGRTPLEAG